MSVGGQGNINVNISGNAQGLVTAMNQAQTSTTKTMTTIQQQQGKTAQSTQTLAEKFSGNRGLIYSMGTIFGTITGVVAEFALLEEAQNSVGEATDKLRELEAKGMQGTQQYTQAQQQLEKAHRFERFTIRNLALAITNFIPEILLLVTSLSKAKVASEAASKGSQVLGTAQKALATETVVANAAMKVSNATMLASGKPIQDLRVAYMGLTTAEIASGEAAVAAGTATRRALIRTGIGALLVAAGTALLAFIENWGKFRDKVNEAGAALGKFMPILKPILDIMSQIGHWLGQVLGNEAKTGTDEAAKGFQKLSKEAQQAAEDVQKSWDEALNNLVEMTKKERLKVLKDLGFGKKGRKELEFGIEIVADEKEIFKQLADSLQIINRFKPDAKVIKPWANNMIETMRDAMKDAGGKLDILGELIDLIKKNKSNPDLPKLVAGWFDNLPKNIKAELALNGISPDEIIKTIGFVPGTLGTSLQTAISDSVARVDFEAAFTKLNAVPGSRFATPNGGGGFVDQFIKAIEAGFTKESLAGAGNAFTSGFVSAITWTGVQVAPVILGFGQALGGLFKPGSMKTLGDQFVIAFTKSILWAEDNVKWVVVGFGQSLIKLFQPGTWKDLTAQFETSFVSSVLWLEATVKPIVTGLADQLIGLFTVENLGKVGEALSTGMLGAKITADALQTFFTTVETELLKLFNTINLAAAGTGLISGILGGAKAAQDALTTFLDTVDQALHNTFSVKSMAAVGELLVTSILGAGTATTNALNIFLETVTDSLQGIFTVKNLTSVASTLWDGIVGALGALPDLAGKLLVVLNTAFKEAINALFKAFSGSEENIIPGAFSPGKDKPPPTTSGVDYGSGVKDTRGTDTKNLDIMNRQIVTITQNIKALTVAYNVLAKATLVVNADILKLVGSNNSYARTITVVTSDSNAWVKANNVVAKTLVTVGQDVGSVTKSNNSYAKTIVNVTQDTNAWTKANNVVAKTLVIVSKDVGAAVKQMNTFARTLVTVGKDASSAAKDVKTLSSAINGLKSKTVTLTTIKKTVTQAAHASGITGGSAHASGNGDMNIVIMNTDEYGNAKKRKFKAELGRGSYRFG